jgi:hypothetical protein
VNHGRQISVNPSRIVIDAHQQGGERTRDALHVYPVGEAPLLMKMSRERRAILLAIREPGMEMLAA